MKYLQYRKGHLFRSLSRYSVTGEGKRGLEFLTSPYEQRTWRNATSWIGQEKGKVTGDRDHSSNVQNTLIFLQSNRVKKFVVTQLVKKLHNSSTQPKGLLRCSHKPHGVAAHFNGMWPSCMWARTVVMLGSCIWDVTEVSGRFTSEEVSLKRRLGGPQSRSDRFGKTNLALSRNRTSILWPIQPSHYTNYAALQY